MEKEALQASVAPDAHTAQSLQLTLKKEEGPQDGLVTMPSVRTRGRLLPRRLCSPCWPSVLLSWLGHPTEGPRKTCVYLFGSASHSQKETYSIDTTLLLANCLENAS